MWQEVIFSRRVVSSQGSVYGNNDFSHLVIKKKSVGWQSLRSRHARETSSGVKADNVYITRWSATNSLTVTTKVMNSGVVSVVVVHVPRRLVVRNYIWYNLNYIDKIRYQYSDIQ